ncbi:hypothetical protein RYH80_18215 [Halobaculum sp. MBLA0147]|uniref:hypothetical protein n=1 Tax=Halobaculum sp. MBLA0147 TaxID=3079934 RepID=UPI00352641A8
MPDRSQSVVEKMRAAVSEELTEAGGKQDTAGGTDTGSDTVDQQQVATQSTLLTGVARGLPGESPPDLAEHYYLKTSSPLRTPTPVKLLFGGTALLIGVWYTSVWLNLPTEPFYLIALVLAPLLLVAIAVDISLRCGGLLFRHTEIGDTE